MGEAALRALKQAVGVGDFKVNGGLAFDKLGATVVAREGTVCAITCTGPTWSHQGPGSRVMDSMAVLTTNRNTWRETPALA